MNKAVNTNFTEEEFRQMIREELQTVISNIPGLPKIEINEGYITVKQAADYLKLVTGTVYGLVHANKIPFHKTGRRVLFKRSELDKWVLLGLEN